MVSPLGPTFADSVTGTVVVEAIFTVQGMGRFCIQGAINRTLDSSPGMSSGSP